jgi:hypothetical protein
VTGVEALTLPAFTVNVAELDPGGIDTLEGTLATAGLELESDTATPPAPAGAVRLTVPVPVSPLMMLPGLTATLLSAGGGGLTVIPKVAFTAE